MKKNIYYIGLFLIMVIGLFLRIKLAIINDMWLDEVFDFFTGQSSVKQIILVEHFDKAHPPLYFLFLHFWQKIDITPLALRLPTVAAFVPSLLIVFLIGKKSCSILAGLVAAIFFSFNPFLVDFGWQARPYGFEVLFSLLFIYALMQTITRKTKTWSIVGIIAGVLGFFSDYSFIWLFLSFFICLIIIFFKKGKKFFIAYKQLLALLLICLLIFLLYMPIFVKYWQTALKLVSFRPRPNFLNLSWTIGQISGFFGFLTVFANKSLGIIFVYFFIILSALGAYLLKTTEKTVRSLFTKESIKFLKLLLIILFFFSVPFSFLFSQISYIFVARNLALVSFLPVFGLPFLLCYSANNLKKKRFALFLFLISLAVFGISMTNYVYGLRELEEYDLADRIPWRLFREQYLGGEKKKLIVWVGKDGYEIIPLEDYYLAGFDYGKNRKINYFEKNNISVEYVYNLGDLEKLKARDYWFILIFSKKKFSEENLRLLEATKVALQCDEEKCKHFLILK